MAGSHLIRHGKEPPHHPKVTVRKRRIASARRCSRSRIAASGYGYEIESQGAPPIQYVKSEAVARLAALFPGRSTRRALLLLGRYMVCMSLR